MEPGQYRACIPFLYIEKSGVPYSKARKDSATQAPEKQDRNAIHLETTRLTHSPETLMLSSGRRASSSSPSRKSVPLLNLAQVVQKLRGVQSFLFSSIFSPQPPDGKPEGLDIFGLAERSYDDEIDFVVRLLNDSCHS